MNATPLPSLTHTVNVPMRTASIDARTKENYDLAPSDAPIIASPIKKSLNQKSTDTPAALHLPPIVLPLEDRVLYHPKDHELPVTNPCLMTPIGGHENWSIESTLSSIVEQDADPRW
jgi:hypothetical protein